MSDKQESYVSEKIVSLIFDQVKGASEDTAKTVGELAEGITELIIKIGNTPSETLIIIKKIEDLVKDLERDTVNIKEKLDKLEVIKTELFNADKKIEGVSTKFDNLLIKLTPIDKISEYLEKISNNIWKFYTVIAIAFSMGLLLIGIVTYLQHSVSDLSQALEAVQKIWKTLPTP